MNSSSVLPLVEKSTIFFIPFYVEGNSLMEPSSQLWHKEHEVLTDEKEGNAMYPYIMSFLQGQMNPSAAATHANMQIYSIADSSQGAGKDNPIVNKFWNKFVQSEHTVEVGDLRNPKTLRFQFISGKNKLLNPHLFIYQESGIGILSFCVSLTAEDASSTDLKLMNYHLHKLYHPLAKCVCLGLSTTGKESPDIRQAKENTFAQARNYIGEHKQHRDKSPKEGKEEGMEFTWNILSLCTMLLNDIQGGVKLFSPSRIHLLTFATIDDSSDNVYTANDIVPELYSLSRVVNDKYLLPASVIHLEDDILQAFENVQVASCVEGTSFVAVMKKENKEFFSNFRNHVSMRYYWIYLLVLVQRYSLLNIDRILTDLAYQGAVEEGSAKKHSQLLWQYLHTIQEVKVRCHFTEISPYTQHNAFYAFCCDKLHVNTSYEEIDKKIKVLDRTISHELQLQNEEEMRAQEKRDHHLNLFLGILAALQAIGILYQFLEALLFTHDYCAAWLYLALIALAVVLVLLIYRIGRK